MSHGLVRNLIQLSAYTLEFDAGGLKEPEVSTMTSILNGVQEFVTPSFLSRVSTQTGESEAAVSKGLAAVLPTLLAGIANRSGDSGFMSQLANLATNAASDPDALTRSSTAITADGTIDPRTTTGGWLSALSGGSLSTLTNAIARYSGVRASSASSLLTYGAPLVLGYLGNLMRSDHLDASKLAKRLQAERGSITAALPSGFAALMPGLPTDSLRAVGDVKRRTDQWIWPLALLALAVVGLLWWNSRDRSAVSSRVNDAAANAVGAVNSAARTLTRVLPGGIQLNVPAGGMEDRLISYVTAPTATGGSFDFDRIEFETGSTLLTAPSQAQLANVASILKAYTATRVVIAGHTDNTGDEAANLALSRGRAESVMKALTSAGVPVANVQAQGFGSQSPIADNSTEAGRARNRRVTLSVSRG
jgi:OOP family OmpA-OmpF porin